MSAELMRVDGVCWGTENQWQKSNAAGNVRATHNVKRVTLCGMLQHYTSMIQPITLLSTHNVTTFLMHNVKDFDA